MPNWTRAVRPQQREKWRRAGRWNPVTIGARDSGGEGAAAPVPASSWTSARPAAARGGPVTGQGRAAAPTGPMPTEDETSSQPEQDEQLAVEGEPAASLHANAYAAQTESTGYDDPPPLTTKSKKEREKAPDKEPADDLPPRLHANAYATQTESTGYDDPPQRVGAGAAPYEDQVPHLDREEAPAPDEEGADPYAHGLSFMPEDPEAARLGAARRDLEQQVAGKDPLADEDPSSWAPLKEAKPRHNRLVARLAKQHVDEKGKPREDLVGVAKKDAKTLEKLWDWLEKLRTIAPESQEDLEDFVEWDLEDPFDDMVKGKSHEDMLEILTTYHARLYVKLRRQNIPVSPDGELDEDSPALKDRKVGYDETEQAQAATLVHVDTAGLLRRNSEGNPPVDTSNSVTHFSGAGVEIFVMGVDGDIHLQSHAIGQYHHSSLLDGGDVAMAGEMKVVKGKIQWLSDKSGHYVPSLDHLLQFLHRLKKDGVPLDFQLRGYTIPKDRKYTAAELLDAGADTGEDAWTKLKTKLVWEGFAASKDEAAVLAAIAAAGWRREADGSVVDAAGHAVSDRELRKHLKSHFGSRSPRKVLQGKNVARNAAVKKPKDLGFIPTVRSSDELRPANAPAAPAAPAATMTPLQQRTTTTTGSNENESVEKEDDEDSGPNTPGGYLRSDAEEGKAGTYDEKTTVPPSTAQTRLLESYEQAYGQEPVAQLLTREHLSLDEENGCVRDFMGHALTSEQLMLVLHQNLGPLPGQDRRAPSTYAVVPATAYSEPENQ